MRKGVLLALPLVLISPLVLLVTSVGALSNEAVRAACATTAWSRSGGSVRIGTLNWRGASHHATNPHPGERPYDERVPHMVAKIDASQTTIVGFQEFEPTQARAFLDATRGGWDIVRGRRHDQPSTADAIAYRPAAWRVAEVRYVSIRYGGPTIELPLVRFTSTGDGGPLWVLNTHHPADAVGGSDAMRDAAVRTESALLRELQGDEPSTPLLLVGDMNDRARFKKLFLSVTERWTTANPDGAQIDWIMGGPTVTFADTVVDRSTNDGAHRYTDHPFVHTTADLGAGAPTPGHPAVDPDFTPVSAHAAVPSAPTDGEPATPEPAPSGCPLCPTSVTGPSLPRSTTDHADDGDDTDGAGTPSEAHVAAAAALEAGFRGDGLVTAVAIAGAESAWDPRAEHGTHFGLWQISASHRGKASGWDAPDDIFDPLVNARYAHALYAARSGKGQARFADWIPFQTTDYRGSLSIAGRAVAATNESTAAVAGPDTSEGVCTTSSTVTTELSAELSARLRARIDAMMRTPDGLCGLSWTSGAPCTYNNQCPKVVDALYGGLGVGRGYGDGEHVAHGIIDAGLAQSYGAGIDPLPPTGAVLSYDTGNGVGHVAVHVGGGRIFGNDYGCRANGVFGCVGFADIGTPGGSVTWALPIAAFDLGGMPSTAS